MNLIYEGKAKKIFEAGKDKVVLYFKDDATAGNAAKKAQFEGKGALNCNISALLFEELHRQYIDTHFIEKLSDREHLCQKVDIIPIEVIVRNVAAGTFCKRYGLEIGTSLKNTVVEWCVKDDSLKDPPINTSAAVALGYATEKQLRYMEDTAVEINAILAEIFEEVNLTLVDFKLEFGLNKDKDILLADEICPDTLRLWNDKNESFDKDLFRNDTGDLIEGYKKVERLLKGCY